MFQLSYAITDAKAKVLETKRLRDEVTSYHHGGGHGHFFEHNNHPTEQQKKIQHHGEEQLTPTNSSDAPKFPSPVVDSIDGDIQALSITPSITMNTPPAAVKSKKEELEETPGINKLKNLLSF